MGIQQSAEHKTTPPNTKLDFGYNLSRGGIQYQSEGFSFEENKQLLQLLITRSRIRFYTVCMTLLVVLAAFFGKGALTSLQELFWPP